MTRAETVEWALKILRQKGYRPSVRPKLEDVVDNLIKSGFLKVEP